TVSTERWGTRAASWPSAGAPRRRCARARRASPPPSALARSRSASARSPTAALSMSTRASCACSATGATRSKDADTVELGLALKAALRGETYLSPAVSRQVTCDTSAPVDQVEETTTSPSGLHYDAASGQYIYVWKSDKAWVGTCRQFTLRLTDGTDHIAL